ncbi:MAG: hypothetical protein PHR35_14030, partial [Kiritimatiellae bacterium]|nr:hypothetical protein [Kiritimatiellia bacterium]
QRLSRAILPLLTAGVLGLFLATLPGTIAGFGAAAAALRRAMTAPAGALCLALALAAALMPPSLPACAPGAPQPDAFRHALRRFASQALLGLAAGALPLLAWKSEAALPWPALLVWLTLCPWPRLFRLSYTPLLAGPLVWCAMKLTA